MGCIVSMTRGLVLMMIGCTPVAPLYPANSTKARRYGPNSRYLSYAKYWFHGDQTRAAGATGAITSVAKHGRRMGIHLSMASHAQETDTTYTYNMDTACI